MSENEGSAVTAAAAILLENDICRIEDESSASRIHNKGFYGTPVSGGGLDLDLIETAFLSESGRINVTQDGSELSGEKLFLHCTTRIDDFETKFLVYRDLRGRGLVVKPSHPSTYKTYPRASIPGKSSSDLWVDVISERDGFVLSELFQRADHIGGLRKRYVLAIVDEEGDLTYYAVERRTPKGKYPPGADLGEGSGLVAGDKVLIWDSVFAHKINEAEFFGKFVTAQALGLSLFEAGYLLGRGIIKLHDKDGDITQEAFEDYARGIEPDYDVISGVYTHLKEEGLLVKTGFKYGSHFRAYKEDPDDSHSQYLFWAAGADYKSTWPEIGRAIRLAHTVNKDFIIGSIGSEKMVDYLGIARIKP